MKSKTIQLKAEIKDFGLQKTINITINSIQSKELVLLLLLLRETLVDSLEIKLDNFSIYLKLDSNSNRSVCSFFNMNKKTFKGSISKNSLEYAIYYLLKYFRDEIGEAEHIDLDFEYDKGGCITLSIKADSYKEYSSEDINNLLGLLPPDSAST